MKSIKILFLNITLMSTHCLYSGLFLPADTLTTDLPAKTSRNNIFSSVKKEAQLPFAPRKPIIPDVDFSDTMQDPTRVVTPDTEEPKIAEEKNNKPAQIAPKASSRKIDNDASFKKTVEEKAEHKEPGVLYQKKQDVQDAATIAFNFEEASLSNLVSYIEAVHDIKFIHDEIITPAAKDAKGYSGHKISFRTNKNLTRKESWDLFLTFLHMAGLDVVPLVQEGFYKIVPLARASSETIPTFIGVDVNILPDTDMIVRFVYFAKNIDPTKIKTVLTPMQGASGKIDIFTGLKALIFTDRACSIKSLMQIVTELDHSVLPEVVSVVKLKRTTAKDVISLYNSLKPGATAAGQPAKVWAPGKKESSLEYFPQDVVLVADDRTNSLILLGTAKDVKRVEDFVVKHVDIALDRPAPPVYTYRLQYTNAKDMATLLHSLVTYGSTTTTGPIPYGGVLNGVKYFQKMTIVADSHSNSLVINATEEDFETLKPLIAQLDIVQKQVGLEVLIVQVKDVDVKTLGAQISGPNGAGTLAAGASKLGPTFLPSVTAQTSGVPLGTPIVTTVGSPATEDFSIKSSLSLLLGLPSLNEVGSVLVTFGRPIWAIFKILKTITSSHLIANPFIVVSNNSQAEIKSGEERRQTSGEVISSATARTTGFTPVEATLTVKITPLINKGNIINLQITVENSKFTQAATAASGFGDRSPRDTKVVKTNVNVANGETLVLGGIMTETYASVSNGVPFLEHIPIFGWFFKSKSRTITRDQFLIFISPRVIDPANDSTDIDEYTDYKLREAQKNIDLIDETDWFTNKKDPIQRAFFGTSGMRVLQELQTSDTFEQRREIDGRVNPSVPALQDPTSTNKRSKKKKKKLQQEQREQEQNINFDNQQIDLGYRPKSVKNSIASSIAEGTVNVK